MFFVLGFSVVYARHLYVIIIKLSGRGVEELQCAHVTSIGNVASNARMMHEISLREERRDF